MNQVQSEQAGNQQQGRQGLHLVRQGVRRVAVVSAMREATTGRAVCLPQVAQRPALRVLPRVCAVAETSGAAPAAKPGAELAFYRKYTEALLRRYLRVSMEVGRVPSVLQRDMFRGHVTHYKRNTLEDGVIFCFDVEKQIARLDTVERELLKRITLQDYTQGEVAGMLGISLRNCVTRYARTLDRLTKLFLDSRLLEPLVDPGVEQAMRRKVVKGVSACAASQVIVIGEVMSEKKFA